MRQPTIGQGVHYVARGSADGRFPKVCRAATVTEVDDPDGVSADLNRIGVKVTNPTGLFFHPLSEGGCEQDNGACEDVRDLKGGSWHWPDYN